MYTKTNEKNTQQAVCLQKWMNKIWIIQSGHSAGSMYPQMNETQQRKPVIDSTQNKEEEEVQMSYLTLKSK